jgi:hypothetical protein
MGGSKSTKKVSLLGQGEGANNQDKKSQSTTKRYPFGRWVTLLGQRI